MKIKKNKIVIFSLLAFLILSVYSFSKFVYSEKFMEGEEIEPEIIDVGEVAAEIPEDLPINEKYSFQDFTGKTLTDIPPEEFNNTVIIGSSFFHFNKPNTWVFPENMTGVVFKQCNLDNVYIPIGNFIITEGNDKSTNKKIKTQNDLDDWILDDNLNPLEPMNKEERLKAGVSINPLDIPEREFTKEERKEFEKLIKDNLKIYEELYD